MNHTLTIVGASVRAAAASAVRAGYQVRAGDLFADTDLRALCAAMPVTDYPRGLARVVRGQQGGAWMYTGALENHPAMVQCMARVRPLLGNSVEVLNRVRDPDQVARVLGAAGLQCPGVSRGDRAVPANETWLRKSVRSAGGAHVCFWQERARRPASSARTYYFQQYVDGLACSAVYVAARRDAALLNVTRQLIGAPWTGSRGFRYCGSIGPLDLSAPVVAQFERIGNVLADRFEMVGIFGVDAVINLQGVWPVEVNPRYTASAELMDWAYDVSTVDLHVAACVSGSLPVTARSRRPGVFGKAIVFATAPGVVGDQLTRHAEARLSRDWPVLADIPAPGTRVPPGAPIVTVFAEAPDEQQILRNLKRAADVVRAAVSPVPDNRRQGLQPRG